MTKKLTYCPICDTSLGNFHTYEIEEVISDHIIFAHPKQAKKIIEVDRKVTFF